MRKILLSELMDSLESGNRPKGGVSQISNGVPSLGGEHLNRLGAFNFDKIKYIPETFYTSLKKGKIKKGDILIVKDGATTGKVSFVNKNFPYEKAAINEHVFILRVNKEKVVSKYLFYYLYSKNGQSQILKTFHGSAIGGINTTFVKYVELPLPSLSIQHKIVSILERAEKLKEKRKHANVESNKIIQNIFHKTFGDDNFEKKTLKKISCLITKGTTPTTYGYKYQDKGIPFLRAENIINGKIDFDIGLKFISEDTHNFLKRSQLKKGDILCTIAGTIGRVAILEVDKEINVNQAVAIIRLKDGINPIYLAKALETDHIKKQQLTKTVQVAQANFSLTEIGNLEIPIPPIELQNQFAEIVKKIESLKEKQKKSTEELDTLFDALMQKAFSGELVS